MRYKLFRLLFSITVLLSLSTTPAAPYNLTGQTPGVSAQAAVDTDFFYNQPTDQIIIKYRDSALRPNSPDTLTRLSSVVGMRLAYSRAMSGEAHVLKLEKKLPPKQVEGIVKSLSALPEVEYAQPDAFRYHTMLPNDTRYTDQWHYKAPTSSSYGINLEPAWDITTGSASVVVAVIDSGIRNHVDLAGRIVPGYDFISNPYVGNDGNGRDNDPSDPGDWMEVGDCGSFPSTFRASSWHGTHVAGTIGALSNNGVGVTGINWNSKILPVRVLGKCGGNDSDIIDGMRWSAGLWVAGVPSNPTPAKVLNLSLGGEGICSDYPAWQNAINDIVSIGATIVIAAGNARVDAAYYTPASCNGVITVAATNRYGDKASYSNYGPSVEIAAPGGETDYLESDGILSTLNSGKYGPGADYYAYYQGTSMAAPHVAGLVSLMYSTHPGLNSTQVLSNLQSTVTPFPSGSSCSTSTCGSGIINAYAVMLKLNPIRLVTSIFIKVNSQPSNQYSGRVTDQGSAAAEQTIELRYWNPNTSMWTTHASTTTNSSGDYSFTNVPNPTGTQEYYARWLNTGSNTAYLSGWWCDPVTASGGSKACSFDIANVAHSTPANSASINLPYAFQWNRRSTTSDSYFLSFYDYYKDWYFDSPELGYVSQWTMMSLPGNMSINTDYYWEINVLGPNGIGSSIYTRAVYFNDTSSPQENVVERLNRIHEDRKRNAKLPGTGE